MNIYAINLLLLTCSLFHLHIYSTSLKKITISHIFTNLYLVANYMYLHYYGKLAEAFNGYFETNDSIHSYNTRSASKIQMYFKRTNYKLKISFSV